MKKVLSIALALALCLTAMMGCFVVSADSANTLAVGSANITVGENASVDVTLTSVGVWALRFDVVSDAAVTAVAIDDANFSADLEGSRVLIQAKDNSYATDLTSAKITLSFGALEVGTYNVAIENIDAGNYAESAVAFDTTAGAIVVAEAVVEPEEPVLVDFTLRMPVLMVQEKYGFRIRIDKDTAAGTYKDANGNAFAYDHYEVVLDTQEYIGENYTLTDAATTFTAADIDESSTAVRDYYFYKNVTAYALNVPISLTVKFYDADNNYVAYSNTLTFSVAELAIAGLANSTTAANLKTMYIDMLNYGTAAQVYFSAFGTNNGLASATPINDGCDAYQQYATKDVPALDGTSTPNDIAGTGFVVTPGLQIAASNNIYYRFTVPTSLTASDLTVTLTHNNLYSTLVENTYEIGSLSIDGKGRYVLPYDAVALYDSNAVVTAVVKDAEGNEIYSFDYNIDYYISANISVAAYADLFNALSKFSVSAHDYFASFL